MTIHFSDPPEVSAAERAVYSGLRGKADLTCIVKAEPRANVSIYTNLFIKKIIQVKFRNIKMKLRYKMLIFFRLLGTSRAAQLNWTCDILWKVMAV